MDMIEVFLTMAGTSYSLVEFDYRLYLVPNDALTHLFLNTYTIDSSYLNDSTYVDTSVKI